MKTFFSLLLLTNLAFAVVQWLFPLEQLLPGSRHSLKPAEKLVLLSEAEQSQPAELIVQVAEEDSPATAPEPVKAVVITGELCYTLGPFKNDQTAQEVAARFKQSDIEINPRSNVEKEYLGMMVFIDGHKNRSEAVKTANDLKSKGIKDHIIFHDPGRRNALSLGVFGLKKNAESRYQRVAKLGFKVKTEPRYRDRTIYWLDYSELENPGLKGYIDQLKSAQGISRISRPCS